MKKVGLCQNCKRVIYTNDIDLCKRCNTVVGAEVLNQINEEIGDIEEETPEIPEAVTEEAKTPEQELEKKEE